MATFESEMERIDAAREQAEEIADEAVRRNPKLNWANLVSDLEHELLLDWPESEELEEMHRNWPKE